MRCFEDPNVVHVAGRIDPISDIEVINTELALADLATADKQLAKYSKVAKAAGQSVEVKEAKRLVDALEKILPALNQAQPVRSIDLSPDERATIRPLFLLTAKPTMYVANVEEHGFDNNPLLDQLRAHAAKEGAPVVAVCAKIEAEIADLSEDDMAIFLTDMGMSEPGLNRVIRAGYTLLGLFTYFTAGPKEVRAWTVTAGSTAPQAAGVIHTDFEKGFIRAETIAFDDYVRCKGENGRQGCGQDATGRQGLRRARR